MLSLADKESHCHIKYNYFVFSPSFYYQSNSCIEHYIQTPPLNRINSNIQNDMAKFE